MCFTKINVRIKISNKNNSSKLNTFKTMFLKNGLIFNAKSKEFKLGDIWLKTNQPSEDLDCSGCLVVPGLVDLHAHVYHDATVLGVEPDKYCLSR